MASREGQRRTTVATVQRMSSRGPVEASRQRPERHGKGLQRGAIAHEHSQQLSSSSSPSNVFHLLERLAGGAAAMVLYSLCEMSTECLSVGMVR